MRFGLTLVAVVSAAIVSTSPASSGAQTTGIPAFSHIVVIVMENRESSRVLGNSEAPYVNQLAAQYSLANNYYGVSHPSLPNYLALIAGDTFGIDTDCTTCFLVQTTITDQIEGSGRTWRTYQESMPGPCFVGDSGSYAQRHNPFIYFNAIRLSGQRCTDSVVPFEQFSLDLERNQLPDFSFITPNGCNDGHDCGTDVADAWLGQVVPDILASPALQSDGLLVITWDEGQTAADCCGGLAHGGKVATILISPRAHTTFVSDQPESHYSLLRTIEDAWSLKPLGHAADVSAMTEYFIAGP